jgi:hypothetical protein
MPVKLVLQDLVDRLDQLEQRALSEIQESLEIPDLWALQGYRDLRVLLALMERTVSLVRREILVRLDLWVLQEIVENLEMQEQRASKEIRVKQGLVVFSELLVLLVRLVRQVSLEKLETSEPLE